MSDAYCGPSTALQNFQKHTTVDRSLQQDRLLNRGSPQENFRSVDPRVGILDQQFDAFLASQPQLGFQEHSRPALHDAVAKGKQPAHVPAPAPDWAADFQRLHIASPGLARAISATPAHSSMHTGARTFTPPGPSTSTGQMSGAYQPQFQSRYGIQGGYGLSHGWMGSGGSYGSAHGLQERELSLRESTSDEQAFEQAFNAIYSEQRTGFTGTANTSLPVSDIHYNIPKSEYPCLPLLRLDITCCLMSPTPQSLHRAAIELSLLEQHDVAHMTDHDCQAIYHLARTFEPVEEFSSARAYNFGTRFRSLADKVRGRIGQQPSFAVSTNSYRSIVAEDFITQFTSQPASAEELQADVRAQLASLPQTKNLSESVLSLISNDLEDPLMSLKTKVAASADVDRLLGGYVASEIAQAGQLNADTWTTASNTHNIWQSLKSRARMEAQAGRNKAKYSRAQEGAQKSNQRPDYEQASPVRTKDIHHDDIQHDPINNDDELAKTAGELLSKVEHDQSAKFKASTFLELMRKFRDGQAKVEGDKVVEGNETGSPLQVGHDGSIGLGTNLQSAPLRASNNAILHASSSAHVAGDIEQQSRRDGQDVVDLLSDPLSSTWNDSQGPPENKRRDEQYQSFSDEGMS